MSTNKSKSVLSSRMVIRKYGQLTVPKLLVAWRRSEGQSQKEFAKKIGISAANLCDIEKGRKGLSLAKAEEVAERIGYSPITLVQLLIQDQLRENGLGYCVEVRKRTA